MTWWHDIKTRPSVSPYISSADRYRMTIPRNLFENRFEYDTQDILWEEPTNINGSVIHLPNESACRLQIGSNSGDKLARQTRQYFKYSSGKPLTIKTGIRFDSVQSGVRKRSGLYTIENGLYLEVTENDLTVVRRSKADGTVQEERIKQKHWNGYKLNGGLNPGITLDISKVQMLVFRDDWYGAGTPAVGLQIDDVIYWAHKFYTANKSAFPNLGSPSLPIRSEIENLTATSGNSNLDLFGGTCIIDGDEDIPGYNFGVSNDFTPVTAQSNILTMILTIKPKLLFRGFENRARIDPLKFSIFGEDNNTVGMHYKLIRNPTFSSVLTYNDVDNLSSVEHAVGDGSITVSGGEVIQPDYLSVGGKGLNGIESDVNSRIPLTIDALGNSADTLSIAAGGLGSNANAFCSFKWKEIY